MNSVSEERVNSKETVDAAHAEPQSEQMLGAERFAATEAEEAEVDAAPPAVDAIDAAIDAEISKENENRRASCVKRGAPFVDYPRTHDQILRDRAMRVEAKALASRESDSLRSRLMRILSAGSYVDDDGETGHDCTPERALLRYAAATTKAAGLALIGAEYARSNENLEVPFSDMDAAIVMCGLSQLLEVGPELITSISSADSKPCTQHEPGAAE